MAFDYATNAEITRHLVSCADLLEMAANVNGLDDERLNLMQRITRAGEFAYQSAELRAEGRDDDADAYAFAALWKAAQAAGVLNQVADAVGGFAALEDKFKALRQSRSEAA